MLKSFKALLLSLCLVLLLTPLAACSDTGGLLDSVDEDKTPQVSVPEGEQVVDATGEADEQAAPEVDTDAAAGADDTAAAPAPTQPKDSGDKTTDKTTTKTPDKTPAKPATKPKAATTLTIKFSVDCSQAVDVGDATAEKVSNNGAMYSASIKLKAGATVLDALKASKLVLSLNSTPMGTYVKAISSLKEGISGYASSGWTYYVNGKFASKSCDLYKLKQGDTVKWVYSLSAKDL